MTFNLILAIVLLISALAVFNMGDKAAQTSFIETLGKIYLTMFGIEPFFVAFYLYWPKGE
ncbi:hypothetical protein NF867_07760 [Solitalea sp. MAHUQ-68]|uniref:Uncharacterized protein n=1 Tax=Solitalea agri TaxID=2953739 RepID=A0A9X2F937_9SPHI|nr:hypothetical protein [Solitalea agri]MCO4292753.1 hypothetical protein [Solitalea agri]